MGWDGMGAQETKCHAFILVSGLSFIIIKRVEWSGTAYKFGKYPDLNDA